MLCWNEPGEYKCLLLSISAVLTPLALLFEGLLSPGLNRQTMPRSDWSHAAHRYARNSCEGKKLKEVFQNSGQYRTLRHNSRMMTTGDYPAVVVVGTRGFP